MTAQFLVRVYIKQRNLKRGVGIGYDKKIEKEG
jgi:hypothetical protein